MSDQPANVRSETTNGRETMLFETRKVDGTAQILVNMEAYALPGRYAGCKVRVTTNADGTLRGVKSEGGEPIEAIPVNAKIAGSL